MEFYDVKRKQKVEVDESNVEKVDEVKNIIQLNARHQNKLKVRL